MAATHSRTQSRYPLRTTPEPPAAEPDPVLGLWSYRLALVQSGILLIGIAPFALALGLHWVTWEQTTAVTPILRKLVFTVWTLSLLGVVLGVIGLSQFGAKNRTLRGLALHLLFAFGPLFAALILRS